MKDYQQMMNSHSYRMPAQSPVMVSGEHTVMGPPSEVRLNRTPPHHSRSSSTAGGYRDSREEDKHSSAKASSNKRDRNDDTATAP